MLSIESILAFRDHFLRVVSIRCSCYTLTLIDARFEYKWDKLSEGVTDEGAKRPSSSAGLDGRSAERTCRLFNRKFDSF